MKLARYCTCGSSMNGTISPDHRAESLLKIWNEQHSGEGHSPCDSKTASRARAKQDREEEKAGRQ